MLESLVDAARSFVGSLRFADVLDIALMACLVFWLLMSVRRRAATAGVAIAVLGLTYFVARWLDMFLTQWLFQVGLTVIILALLFLFQDDARRHLERLLDFRSWARGPAHETSSIADVLIEALSEMKREHTGALVVLPGRDSLARHVRGGVPLDGRVSVPLLLSLFDSSSAGHDGAVVIEGDRISLFSGHLPLSRRVYATQGGTRHSAALGLAEHTDALVLVVSEERGVVSVAHEAAIRELTSTAEIGGEIEAFLELHDPGRNEIGRMRWLIGNLGTKAAALAIALLLWGTFAWNVEAVQRTFEVPVEFRNVPARWSVYELEPSKVRVTLSGPANHFELLDQTQLRFSLKMQESSAGLHSVWLGEQALSRPGGLEVRAIEPQRVWFQVAARGAATSPPP